MLEAPLVSMAVEISSIWQLRKISNSVLDVSIAFAIENLKISVLWREQHNDVAAIESLLLKNCQNLQRKRTIANVTASS